MNTEARRNDHPLGWTVDELLDTHLEQQLEREADMLLLESREQRGPGEYPFYTEAWMTARVEDDHNCVAGMPPDDAPWPSRGLRLSAELRYAFSSADLLPMERRVLLLRLQGTRNSAAAGRLGVAPKAASGYLHRAKRKLSKAARAVLNSRRTVTGAAVREVFDDEVNRYRYRPPRHCPPGEEACRPDGVCTRRPYLHYPLCRG